MLRLEAEVLRLEGRLVAGEIRASNLAQSKPVASAAGGPAPGPAVFALTVNARIVLGLTAPGTWAGSTVTILNGSGTAVGPVGVTDAWGWWNDWFTIPIGDAGQTYTASVAHAGYTTDTSETYTIGSFGLNNFAFALSLH